MNLISDGSTGPTNPKRGEEMFWFKGCPKCHGDLYSNSDVYGSYAACLQCSRYLTETEEAQLGLTGAQLENAVPVSIGLERLAA